MKISTTKLSRKFNITGRKMFNKLEEQELIYREDGHWNLTEKGKEFGGEKVFTQRYGEFIVWPPDFNPLYLEKNKKQELADTQQ